MKQVNRKTVNKPVSEQSGRSPAPLRPGKPGETAPDQPAYSVIITGGGPVGLFLALCLIKSGISCKVLEKRTRIDSHSKSIGIHPVSLELFDEAGITAPFLNDGLKIRRGYAYIGRRRCGCVSFDTFPPYNYILTLPQNRTEEILEQELHRVAPSCLVRGADVTTVSQTRTGVQISYTRQGKNEQLTGSWLAGCDGKNSRMRKSAGIKLKGKPYPDTYIMGDFSDHTALGPDAAVYLHRDGLVESFPLPGRTRRWVVKTPAYIENPDRYLIERLVMERLGEDLSRSENSMTSSFGVQHYLCDSFFRKRILLAGDSAQIVSPIGGQGMNLGWLSARDLAETLRRMADQPERQEEFLLGYSRRNRRMAVQVARRATLNMWLGRERRFPLIRNLLIRTAVNSPVRKTLAGLFTMRGLGKWPV